MNPSVRRSTFNACPASRGIERSPFIRRYSVFKNAAIILFACTWPIWAPLLLLLVSLHGLYCAIGDWWTNAIRDSHYRIHDA